jgi:hypothetical protein
LATLPDTYRAEPEHDPTEIQTQMNRLIQYIILPLKLNVDESTNYLEITQPDQFRYIANPQAQVIQVEQHIVLTKPTVFDQTRIFYNNFEGSTYIHSIEDHIQPHKEGYRATESLTVEEEGNKHTRGFFGWTLSTYPWANKSLSKPEMPSILWKRGFDLYNGFRCIDKIDMHFQSETDEHLNGPKLTLTRVNKKQYLPELRHGGFTKSRYTGYAPDYIAEKGISMEVNHMTTTLVVNGYTIEVPNVIPKNYLKGIGEKPSLLFGTKIENFPN